MKLTGPRLRPATQSDAPALAQLTTQLGYAVGAEQIAERLSMLLDGERSTVLVAADDADRAIGWLHLTVHRSLETAASVRIGGLVVDEGYRSEGIGHRLLEAGERWARERGVARMTLYSRQTRERAHRFYEREGYTIAKRSYMFEKDLA